MESAERQRRGKCGSLSQTRAGNDGDDNGDGVGLSVEAAPARVNVWVVSVNCVVAGGRVSRIGVRRASY